MKTHHTRALQRPSGFEHIAVAATRLLRRPDIVRLGPSDSACTFARIRIARSFLTRLVGLLGRRGLGDDEGLLLVPGGSIHTIGMRFSIDVVFLDAGMNVVRVAPDVSPWTFLRAPRGTRYVLEVAAGRATESRLQPGVMVGFKGRG